MSPLWPAVVPWAGVDLSLFWASCMSGPGAEPGWALEDGRGRGWVFGRASQLPPAVALLPRPGRLGGVPHTEDAHGDGDDQVSGLPLWDWEGGPTGATLGAGRAGPPAALRSPYSARLPPRWTGGSGIKRRHVLWGPGPSWAARVCVLCSCSGDGCSLPAHLGAARVAAGRWLRWSGA